MLYLSDLRKQEGEARQDWAQQAGHTLTGPAVPPGMMWGGRKRMDQSCERAVGVLGEPFVPSLTAHSFP